MILYIYRRLNRTSLYKNNNTICRIIYKIYANSNRNTYKVLKMNHVIHKFLRPIAKNIPKQKTVRLLTNINYNFNIDDNNNNNNRSIPCFINKQFLHFNTKALSRRVPELDLYTDIDSPRNVIQGYSANGIQVNNITYLGSQLIFPDLTLLWDVEKIEDITKESLNFVIHAEPKVDTLLIGTGKTFVNLDEEIVDWLYSYGVTADVMSTAHACQTFNVLNQEDRRIAAAVLPMETTHREEIIASTFS